MFLWTFSVGCWMFSLGCAIRIRLGLPRSSCLESSSSGPSRNSMWLPWSFHHTPGPQLRKSLMRSRWTCHWSICSLIHCLGNLLLVNGERDAANPLISPSCFCRVLLASLDSDWTPNDYVQDGICLSIWSCLCDVIAGVEELLWSSALRDLRATCRYRMGAWTKGEWKYLPNIFCLVMLVGVWNVSIHWTACWKERLWKRKNFFWDLLVSLEYKTSLIWTTAVLNKRRSLFGDTFSNVLLRRIVAFL